MTFDPVHRMSASSTKSMRKLSRTSRSRFDMSPSLPCGVAVSVAHRCPLPKQPDSASDAASPRPTIREVALIVVLTLLAGALLAPGLPIGPSLDAAVFSHVGGRILDGVAPYVGAWDHKPPGIYLATAAAQVLLGWLGPWTAEWLLSLAATVGLGAAVAAALARLQVTGWPRTLAAAGATILASHYLLALGGGLTEPPATALVAWALVLVLATGPTSSAHLAGVGALVGLAALFSVQLLPAGLVVLALAVFLRPDGTRPRAATAMSLGFAAPLALVAAWLAVIGVLPVGFAATSRDDRVAGVDRCLAGALRGAGPLLRPLRHPGGGAAGAARRRRAGAGARHAPARRGSAHASRRLPPPRRDPGDLGGDRDHLGGHADRPRGRSIRANASRGRADRAPRRRHAAGMGERAAPLRPVRPRTGDPLLVSLPA